MKGQPNSAAFFLARKLKRETRNFFTLLAASDLCAACWMKRSGAGSS